MRSGLTFAYSPTGAPGFRAGDNYDRAQAVLAASPVSIGSPMSRPSLTKIYSNLSRPAR